MHHAAPKSKDRGPKSEEDTQTDFSAMDMLSSMPVPTTAIDACIDDGFALNSGLKVTGAGVLLVGGEAFRWRPWRAAAAAAGTQREHTGGGDSDKNGRHGGKDGRRAKIGRADGSSGGGGGGGGGAALVNAKGQWDVDAAAWGVLDLVWPKPDLLIVGTGRAVVPLSPRTRAAIVALGVRVEVQDTRNAAAQFNLLATERGVQQVAAALVPIG